jgi:hypothetical protein
MAFWTRLLGRPKRHLEPGLNESSKRSPADQERYEFLLSNGITQNNGFGYKVAANGYILGLWMAENPNKLPDRTSAVRQLLDSVERYYSADFAKALTAIRKCLSAGWWSAHGCSESIGGGCLIAFPCIACDKDPMMPRLWRMKGIDYTGRVFILKPRK